MLVQEVGKINRKRFVTTEETVLDILRQRLQIEKNLNIRKCIQSKIKLFS
jgi:hypothetical protein